MSRYLRDYALGWALLLLFLASWGLQALTHDWAADGWRGFLNATAENWESEFLQLLAFVVLSRFLIFRDSPQSRDGDDRMEAKLDTLLRRRDR